MSSHPPSQSATSGIPPVHGQEAQIMPAKRARSLRVEKAATLRGLPPRERFERKIECDLNSGCWLWSGGLNKFGYGEFYISTKKHMLAHRYSWSLRHGPLESCWGHRNACILHKCDTPTCVNPDHLFFGSQADNMKDMAAKKRSCAGVKNGRSKLTEAQVAEIRALRGQKTQQAIADLYGTTQSYVSQIQLGVTWRTLMARRSEQ